MTFFENLSFFRQSIFLLICFSLASSQLKEFDKQQNFFFQQYNSIFESGVTLRNEGSFKQAVHMFTQSLRLAKRINNEKEQAKCLLNLGILYWNIGKLEDSLNNYKKAQYLAERYNFEKMQNRCQNAIKIHNLYQEGKNFRASYEYHKSIESFEKAIFLSRENESKEHEVKCLRQLSITYKASNNLKEFFYLNQAALKIAQNLNHEKEKGRCLINIGNFYMKVANYSEALDYYDQALNITRNLGNKEDESICLSNIGLIYQYLGDYDRALEYLKNALKIDRFLKNEISISMDLNNMGTIFRARGIIFRCQEDLYKSLFYFNKCLKFSMSSMPMKNRFGNFKKIEVQALNNIGTVLIDLENLNEAQKYLLLGYKKALEIREIEVIGMSLVNLGIVYLHQGNIRESIKSFQNAVKLAKEIGNLQILWEAYFGLGQCYEKRIILDQSVKSYKNAIDVIDMIRSQILLDSLKAGFTRDKFKVYEFLINILFKLNAKNPSIETEKEIFHVTQKAKARAFLESLARSKVDMSKRLRKKENEISERISLIKKQLSNSDLFEYQRKELSLKLQREEDKFMSLISQVNLEIPETSNIVSPCRVEQIQQLLNINTALIEYFLGEDQTFMFLITKSEFCVFPLPPRDEIGNSIKAFLKMLSNPPKVEFDGILAAKRIYNELIFPAEKKIKNVISNLIIIPDGVLYYLPFETLVRSNNGNLEEEVYLIKDYRISYAPSSSILFFLSRIHHENSNPKGLLAFGNPFYSFNDPPKLKKQNINIKVSKEVYLNKDFAFSSLPYSGREIKKISKYFPHEKRDIFINKNAKEEVIKEISLIDYRIIHFACHALLDEKFPFRSGLILSFDEDSKEDGFLQVREIYSLKLNTDLVVLSACQTGKGKLEIGEGVLGFPRIFFYAGAKSVLFSLWRINDESTAIFMNYFYYYLSQENEKAQALRLAKLKMIESKFCHPFYWAAFVLNGDFNSTIVFK
jgi:CHAT domain-containing protein